jgi:thymidylate synthase (FAD)
MAVSGVFREVHAEEEKGEDSMRINVLDHGFVRLVETWGKGDAGVPEAGIIEAARQSTQGAFRSWAPYKMCEACGVWTLDFTGVYDEPCFKNAGAHEWKTYPRGDVGLLSFLFSNKPPHATPFEFAGLVLEVKAPIFVFREWHRHRTQSYNEMSARYAPLPNENYIPTVERLMRNAGGTNKQAGTVKDAVEMTVESAEWFRGHLERLYDTDEVLYQEALTRGVPKELARVHLPVGRYSQMRASTCLRNWLGFLTLRADRGAQWEIQEYARAVGTIIKQEMPRTWELFDLGRAA